MRYTGQVVAKIMLSATLAAGCVPMQALAFDGADNAQDAKTAEFVVTGTNDAAVKAYDGTVASAQEQKEALDDAKLALDAAKEAMDAAEATDDDITRRGMKAIFELLSKDESISQLAREDAARALKILNGEDYSTRSDTWYTLPDGSKKLYSFSKPDWFDQLVQDAEQCETSPMSRRSIECLASQKAYERTNEIRATDERAQSKGCGSLNVSFTSTALASIRACYSSYYWGHANPGYGFEGGENIATYGGSIKGAYQGWYDDEKAIVDYYDEHPDEQMPAGTVTGHYTNLIDPGFQSFGMAVGKSTVEGGLGYTVTVWDASYYEGDVTVEEYRALLSKYLNASSNAKTAYEEAKVTYEEAKAAYDKAVAEPLRIAGQTRYDTSAAISAAGFEKAGTVVVASGENFPDALAASSLAGVYGAPVLLTNPDELSQRVVDEIDRLGADDIIVVGGEKAVSDNVFKELNGRYATKGFRVSRIAGQTREDTANKIALKLAEGFEGDAGIEWGDTCIIASGTSYADALAASPYAYAKHAPIFLTNESGELSGDTFDVIKRLGFKHAIVVGGTARIPDSTVQSVDGLSSMESVERVAGQTRYETATKMAQRCVDEGMSYDGVSVASGDNFPDAIAGGALAGARGSVLLLAGGSDEDMSYTLNALASHKGSISTANILGGSAAVSDSFGVKMAEALGLL